MKTFIFPTEIEIPLGYHIKILYILILDYRCLDFKAVMYSLEFLKLRRQTFVEQNDT